MLAAALITFREGLEAALIIGIVLAALRRAGRPEWRAAVWWGRGRGVALTLARSLLTAQRREGYLTGPLGRSSSYGRLSFCVH